MWTRLGTPTPRALSGTAEELDDAIARWKQNPNGVDVLFFFNQQNPPIDLDIDQFAALRNFKASVSDRGVFYREYQDLEQFRVYLTMALNRIAQRWATPGQTQPPSGGVIISDEVRSEVTYVAPVDDEEEDEGLLDLLADHEEAMSRSNESVERMTASMDQLGTRVREKAAQLEGMKSDNNFSPTKARRLVNDVAEDLDTFARGLETELPTFRQAWGAVMDRLPRLFTAWSEMAKSDEEKEGVSRVRDALRQLNRTVTSTTGQLTEFRETVANLPRMTSRFRKAQRRALASIDDFVAEVSRVIGFTAEFSK